MTKLLQILLLFVATQWFGANGKPLFQGISFQRGFEINFKPLPRKPISFIKEKWSPFGVFGRKHVIQKRSSDELVPIGPVIPVTPVVSRSAAPVYEQVDDIKPVETLPLTVLPPQPPRTISPVPTVPPLIISSIAPVPSSVVSHEPIQISSPAPPSTPTTVVITPTPTINQPIIGEVPPAPVEREEVIPPISSNMVIPPLTRVGPPPSGLYTDIARPVPVGPISPPLAVEEKVAPPIESNSIKPEPPNNDVVLKENSFIRGSKLALYFGNVFLQLISQFLTNARASFDQMTNPPPEFKN